MPNLQMPKTSATVVAVLDEAQRPLTKAEIGRRAGLSRPTVASALSALQERGLVMQEDDPDAGREGPVGPGRPPATFRLTDEAGVVLAVDVGHRGVRVALADAAGTLIEAGNDRTHLEERVEVEQLGPRVVDLAATMAARLAEETGVAATTIRGVGIGIPAPLTLDDQVAGSTYLIGWKRIDIRRALARALGRELPDGTPWAERIFVDNDANIGVLAQAATTDVQNLVYVKVSSGIGTGLLLGGRLYRGGHGAAGELGHMSTGGALHGLDALPGPSLEPPAARLRPQCPRCGKADCLELFASADALMRALRARSERYADKQATDVIRAALDDPLSNAAITAVGRSLGLAVAQMSALLDPELIVLGGVMADAGDLLLEPLRETAARHGLGLDAAQIELTGDRKTVGIRGAVALALSRTAPLFVKA